MTFDKPNPTASLDARVGGNTESLRLDATRAVVCRGITSRRNTSDYLKFLNRTYWDNEIRKWRQQ